MIKSKSQLFELILYVIIVFTIGVKVYYLFATLNPLHLIAPVIALVVGVLLLMKEPAVIAWIKAWAVLEIAADLIVLLSSGCQLLIGAPSEKTPIEQILYFSGICFGMIIASAFYLLVSDYLIVVPQPTEGSNIVTDAVTAEKLTLPKD